MECRHKWSQVDTCATVQISRLCMLFGRVCKFLRFFHESDIILSEPLAKIAKICESQIVLCVVLLTTYFLALVDSDFAAVVAHSSVTCLLRPVTLPSLCVAC